MLYTRKILPILLLGIFWWLARSDSTRVGVTADEPVHVTAGYLYWTVQDYRFQPENGNLPQRLAALPLLLNPPAYVPTEQAEPDAWRSADIWALSRKFFYTPGNDATALLAAARSGITLLGCALVWTIFAWTRSLFGSGAALFSLALAVFCPHLLAHAGVATSDLAATLGFLLAVLTWWRLFHRITAGRIIAAGLAAGLLAVAKYSAALFAPMAVALIVVRLLHNAPLALCWSAGKKSVRGAMRALWLAAASAAAALLAVIVIWSFYGFRYSATPGDPPAKFVQSWTDVLMEKPRMGGSLMADGLPAPDPFELKAGAVQHFVNFARKHRLLPEAYLYGLAFSDRHARGRLAYFAGEYRERGWKNFFPTAFLLKTTLPALLVFGFAVARITKLRNRGRLGYRLTPLIVLTFIYGGFSVMSHLNIGHRHILPLYPPLYIACGALAIGLRGRLERWAWAAMGTAVITQAIAAGSVRPHYLTYFNALAGGPAGGHRFFVDSSLDWGQGLPELKRWLDARPTPPALYLSYFGSDEPTRLGIHATRIGDPYFNFAPRPILPELHAGTYVISATMLRRVYTEVRGAWSTAYEQRYQEIAGWLADHPTPSTERRTHLATFEQLRFGRLCHYLETRRPEHVIENLFFVYELSAPEIESALNGPIVH